MPPTPKKPADKTYRSVAERAMILEGGRPVEPGEYVTLSEDQVTGITQLAIQDGKLIDATDVAPTGQQTEPPPEEGA